MSKWDPVGEIQFADLRVPIVRSDMDGELVCYCGCGTPNDPKAIEAMAVARSTNPDARRLIFFKGCPGCNGYVRALRADDP